jgi:hypothetical protein
VTVLAPALHWLHGWQKWEIRNEDAIAAAAHGFPAEAPTVAAPAVEVEPDAGFDLALEDDDYDEFDDLLDGDEFEDTSVIDEEEPVAAGS